MKKVIAVTDIVSDKFKIKTGETLDVTKVTKSQLEELHDIGAIVIEEVKEEVKEVKEEMKEVEIKKEEVTPKTPATLKAPTKEAENKPTTKVSTAPTGRMTGENIKVTGEPVKAVNPSNLTEAGKSNGPSDVK